MATTSQKIVIPGGSGYLGRALAAYFVAHGDRVVLLSRSASEEQAGVRTIAWDGRTLGPWAAELEDADIVINLAGRSVNCRYNAKNRRAIYASRLDSTHVLGEAIAQAHNQPKLWINSSSATIYRDAYDRPMDEERGDLGSGFSVDVCQQWERTFFEAPTPHTRKVALRTAIVFGKGQGSPMEAYKLIVRLGLGGKQGSGKQFVSWVHLDDFIASIQWIIDHPELEGTINVASPNPRTNADFMRILRLVSRQPVGLPATRWMLEIGAFFLRTETELLLKSRRVVPTRLLESGFQFCYPELYPALDNIVNG
jgi:uncharacterized protein (TIGR01777 family)